MESFKPVRQLHDGSKQVDSAAPWPMPIAAVPVGMSVLRQLIWICGSFTLVTGCLVALVLAYVRTQEVEANERLTESFAQLVEEQTTRLIQTIDFRLQHAADELAERGTAGNIDTEVANQVLRSSSKVPKEIPFLRGMWVVDLQGRVKYNADGIDGPVSVLDRDYVQIYHTNPATKFFIGAPVRSRTTGVWMMTASRPLLSRSGEFLGIIVAAVDLSYFDNLWQSVALGSDGSITIYRNDGVMMMRSPLDEALIGKRFPDLRIFKEPPLQGRTGSFRDTSPFDGKHRLFAYRNLSMHSELIVTVGRSFDLILAHWRQMAALVVAVWALASAAICTLCVLLSRAWREKLQANSQAAEMAQRLTLATDTAMIGAWEWDLNTDQWVATPTYFTMMGYDPAQGYASQRHWLDRVHPDDRDAVVEHIRTIQLETPSPLEFEARWLHSDGSFRWLRVVARVFLRDEHHRPTRLLGVTMDVTARRQAEELLANERVALRQSEERYRTLIEWTPEAFCVHRDATLLYVNPAAVTLLRADSALALIGQSIFKFVHPDFHEMLRQRLKGATTIGAPSTVVEMKLCALDGADIDVAIHGTLINYDGQTATQASIRDITARVKAEADLRRLLRDKQALLQEVHHRVKNNLQIINSLLRLEAARSANELTRVVLKDMQGRILSMAVLHEALYRTGNFAEVDLGAYLKQLSIQTFAMLADRRGVIRLEPNLAYGIVNMDQAITCGLLVNELISNSLKHAFPQGRGGKVMVDLKVSSLESRFRLSVSDDGVGLPEDFEAKCGNSLGMQLVYDLAEQLQGQLEIGQGSGAVFIVTFTPIETNHNPIASTVV